MGRQGRADDMRGLGEQYLAQFGGAHGRRRGDDRDRPPGVCLGGGRFGSIRGSRHDERAVGGGLGTGVDDRLQAASDAVHRWRGDLLHPR